MGFCHGGQPPLRVEGAPRWHTSLTTRQREQDAFCMTDMKLTLETVALVRYTNELSNTVGKLQTSWTTHFRARSRGAERVLTEHSKSSRRKEREFSVSSAKLTVE